MKARAIRIDNGKYNGMIFKYGFENAHDDPEKLVTPAILFIGVDTPEGKHCRMIFIGWWHWAFYFGVAWRFNTSIERERIEL